MVLQDAAYVIGLLVQLMDNYDDVMVELTGKKAGQGNDDDSDDEPLVS